MNELIPFNYNTKQVRTVIKDGEPWFVLKDVCDVLEIANSNNVASRLETDEKDIHQADTLGGIQSVLVINESGLYNVILRSDKPEAKLFRKWVTGEVLPSIRKHGMYAKDELLDNPDLLIEVATKLKEERALRLAAENKVATLAPKAESFDAFMSAEGNLTIEETAKTLNIKDVGRNNLFKILVSIGVLFRKGENYEAYQQYVNAGYFVHKQSPIKKGDLIEQRTQVFVTPKGLDWLVKKLGERGYRVDKQMALV